MSGAGGAARREVYVPIWLQVTSLLLSLAGLGVSIYLTIQHYDTKLVLSCRTPAASTA